MAFFASRSVDIRKTDGLLARVGELCGIIRPPTLVPSSLSSSVSSCGSISGRGCKQAIAPADRGTTVLACVCFEEPLSV